MPVQHSRLPLPLVRRGKVRDVYQAPGGRLVLLATDRVSAFDVVLGEAVPDKGRVLTQLTAWWLAGPLADEPHHLLAVSTEAICRAVPVLASCTAEWEGRASLVRETRPAPVECVVRGFMAGSAWEEYRRSGTLAGEPMPPGLAEGAALDPPVFSPATKAREGHDENIPFGRAAAVLGDGLAHELRSRSLALFARASATARERGIVLADTKFEFGTATGAQAAADAEAQASPEARADPEAQADPDALLIDEALTPDSSRFWPVDRGEPGRPPASLDKQPIRDHLSRVPGWNRRPPPPPLPPAVVGAASARYLELFQRLTGMALDDFEPPEFGR